MIFNISKCAAQKQTQNNLMSSQNFLQKNKITVNEVAQAHFTVEGVQAYSPQEIKALKQTQQRKKKLEGTPIEVKVYQVQGYFDEFEEERKMTPKDRVQEALKNKSKLDVKNQSLLNVKTESKKKLNITNRDKMMQNNNVLTKLEKQRGKKSAIEQKLQKLSKHYKQYFKGSKDQEKDVEQEKEDVQEEQDEIELKKKKQKKSVMYESIKKIIKSKGLQDQKSQDEESDQEQKQTAKNHKAQNISFKKGPNKALSIASTHQTKSNYFLSKKPSKPQAKDKNKLQQDKQDSQTQSKGQIEQFEDKLDSISEISKKNKSTYSEKLGSAVHLLFM